MSGELRIEFRSLADAEAHLEAVEEAVLVRVVNMKESGGRVPWPRSPLALSAVRNEAEVEAARSEALYRARKARDEVRYEEEMVVHNRRTREAISTLVDGIQERMDKLSIDKREQVREAIRTNLDRLRNKEISPMEFLGAFQRK